uniref:Attractin n=1 Tax=Denticeps clupeoides TaxID=299321 RepID=A0AAY4BHW9_9TELE
PAARSAAPSAETSPRVSEPAAAAAGRRGWDPVLLSTRRRWCPRRPGPSKRPDAAEPPGTRDAGREVTSLGRDGPLRAGPLRAGAERCDRSCFSGTCVNASCACDPGWTGDLCQHCYGRFRLTEPSGSLTDGPVNYKFKTKCTWLIEGFPNTALRLRFNHFATECNWDHMYVFDGDSIYAPLVAVFSGLIVPESRGNETIPEVVTTSGYALLHFFSDAAYNLTGFNILYSVNMCPNNCSGHGKCSTGNSMSGRVYCECNKYWKGEACDIPYCRNNCGSPDRGYCDLTGEKLCVCNDSWQGPDCSLTVPSTESFWALPNIKPFGQSLGRASHKATVHGKFMWVVGGYTFNYSSFQMVLNYNLESSTWGLVPASGGPEPRYGHSLDVYQDDLYMFGGKLEVGPGGVTDELWVFNVPSQTWSLRTPIVSGPGQLFAVEGHSAHIVEVGSGEAAMVVLFGYSPVYSYISRVQEYHLETNTWLVPETRGAVVQGGYAHSSVYDSPTRAIYVHGGFKLLSNKKYGLVDDLYRYDVLSRTWLILKESGLARYLHSSALISGVILVFGGNTHNDTALSNGAKCFSADLLAYDIACDEWKVLPKPDLHRDVNRFGHTSVVSNGSMYLFGGFSSMILHDVLVYKPPSCEAYRAKAPCLNAGPDIRCVWKADRCWPWKAIHANGSVPASFCPARPDASDERCYRFSDCASCTANSLGCQWCEDKKCISASSNCTVTVRYFTKCSVKNEHICSKIFDCRSCSLSANCQWEPQTQECHSLPAHLCGDGWNHVGEACLMINSSLKSYDNAQHDCKNLGGSIASLTTAKQLEELHRHQSQDKKLAPWVGLRKINVSYWGWEDASSFHNTTLQWLPGEPSDSGFCAYLERAQISSLKAQPCNASPNQSGRQCKLPCSLRTTCANCTSQATECMWCSSTRRCVDSNAYVISFPYGQCLEWKTADCGSLNCSGLRSCDSCLEQPECGWCEDPSRTGRGVCAEGSSKGPLRSGSRLGRDLQLDPSLCSRERGFNWSFLTCPACQCNGHSRCVNGSLCEQCRNLTSGPRCQTCMAGYYGDPTNGGRCQACKCNSHASTCHVNSGKCYCTTKGVKGDHCQLCDSENRYLGNPLRGTCYYNLLIDYQFTFSLVQDDDHHYTAIHFMATPEQNLDMSINASNNFNLNITWSVGSTAGTILGEEYPIISKTNIKKYRDSFSCEKYSFRSNPNITLYVYVSNFSWPIKIQVTHQHTLCFLSLLLVAAVVWKIKQTCWASQRREQLMRERQQMASRPFASVAVELGRVAEDAELLAEQVPSQIALEPCSGNRAAVQTVLVCLPRAPSGVPPPGQSGIAIASALVDIAQQKPGDFKEKCSGPKGRKQHVVPHQGTCV